MGMSMAEQSPERVREAVAVFEDVGALEAAVEELLEAGFAKEDINLLAGFDTVERKLGHRYRRVEDLEDLPQAPRTAFVSVRDLEEGEKAVATSLTVLPALIAAGLVVGSGGAVLAAVSAAAVGGALLATAFQHWMDERRARWLVEQLERGGILLWVRTPDEERERKALEILRRHAAHDVHLHDIPRPR